MPGVPRPPVNEVVHSVAVARQSALSGPLLPSVLRDWFDQHSRVEIAQSYEIPPEAEGFVASLQGPPIQFVAVQSLPRYWLISDDDHELIQVQSDYLALNWRRRSDESAYPGYRDLRIRFRDLLRTAEEGLSQHQGVLKPTRAELTYINTIHPSNLWSSHGETHKLINIALPEGASYERLSFSYSQAIVGSDGDFLGRLHVTLAPAVDWIKQEPQLTLTLTARSSDFSQQSVDSALTFMDFAHSAIEKTFLNLVSEAARAEWGLE